MRTTFGGRLAPGAFAGLARPRVMHLQCMGTSHVNSSQVGATCAGASRMGDEVGARMRKSHRQRRVP